MFWCVKFKKYEKTSKTLKSKLLSQGGQSVDSVCAMPIMTPLCLSPWLEMTSTSEKLCQKLQQEVSFE